MIFFHGCDKIKLGTVIATPKGKNCLPSPLPRQNFGGTKNIWKVKTMANCETCKKVQNAPESVPYIVHESSMARMERTAKRLWITILALIFLLVGSNCVWILYENQFEDIEIVQENADGYNSFIGNDGDIVYGETNGENP